MRRGGPRANLARHCSAALQGVGAPKACGKDTPATRTRHSAPLRSPPPHVLAGGARQFRGHSFLHRGDGGSAEVVDLSDGAHAHGEPIRTETAVQVRAAVRFFRSQVQRLPVHTRQPEAGRVLDAIAEDFEQRLVAAGPVFDLLRLARQWVLEHRAHERFEGTVGTDITGVDQDA